MRRNRYAKIVSTLGPASSTREQIAKLFEAGTDVFRLNFSHGDHEDKRTLVENIRAVEAEFGHQIGIMIDLQGPKIRIGKFGDGSVDLKKGAAFRLDTDKSPGDVTRVHLPHPEVLKALGEGDELLLNDGNIRLEVTKVTSKGADTKVMVGGPLSNNKGVNLPGVALPIPALTVKDRQDLDFALTLDIDWVALSFVQRPEDVAEARKIVAGRAGVLVKLEKPLAMDRLDEILDLADAVMVARGDLGVEAPPEDVPGLQKRIISAARSLGKPVVVATQMLESMINAPTPTRAEASDVANAVFDRADAVMLSAETAVGEYSVEAVSMMDRIIKSVEQDSHYRSIIDRRTPEATSADAITAAARQVSNTISAAAIVTYSATGSTTLRAARERPNAPILGLTPLLATARRMAITWGVHSVVTQDATDLDDMVMSSVAMAKKEGFAVPGQRLVLTAGMPFGTPGATNILRIAWVD